MKPVLLTLAKLSLSVFLFWFLVHTSKLDFELLPHLLEMPMMLAVAFLVSFVTILVSTLRWYLLNQAQSIAISYRRTLLPTYLGIAFNQLLPGGVGGDFYRCYYLFRKMPENKSTIFLSILFDRIMGLMGIFVAISLFAFSYLYHSHFAVLCVLLLGTGLLPALFTFLTSPERGTVLRTRYAKYKWSQLLASLLDGLKIYRRTRLTLPACTLLSVLIQILIAVTCLLIATMLHFPPISFFAMLLAIGLTQIANLIPLAPGGFGVGEMAFANILCLLYPATPASYATIFVAYRLLSMVIYLPGVLIVGTGKKVAAVSA